MTSTSTDETLLRERGLRVTGVRLAVLRALDGHEHSTADDVVRSLRADLGSVSVQAVYDSLHSLTAVGLLRRLEPAGHPARYERRVGDNHHHMVCRGCGAVADVDCTVGEAPCLHPVTTHGFAVELAEVTFWGLCPRCTAGSVPAGTHS
ncbi:transcriptional repressor [Isoptericola sp. NEAU-Y5]|uniref:Transcriptional repressor n=1 Tax=Isoptericola luteus TaxID=2879484 RepID=A0ABS7ZHM8_9MICO|nr:Fur family transcriptional regulator [Isoptericola sp. NEAU-Y5]MCA5893109.1 transcriptional repressor [Isoptericola sp. NEAU-Y5]